MTDKKIRDVEGTLEQLPNEETLRGIGFTDHREGVWYLCERLDGYDWLTFNVDIDKETLEYETSSFFNSTSTMLRNAGKKLLT